MAAPRRPRLPRLRPALTVAAAALALVVLGAMTLDLLRKRNLESLVRSDNVQWNLSQLEVEFLRLENAVIVARNADAEPGRAPDEADFEAIRRWFDVLYSRAASLGQAPIFDGVAAEEHATALGLLRDTLDTWVPLIDGSDAALRRVLPGLATRIADSRDEMRTLSIQGLTASTVMAESYRREVDATLLRVGLGGVALLALLLLLLVSTLRSGRRAQINADAAGEASSRYEALLSSSMDAIIATDSHGRIIEFNATASRLYGWPRDEAVGQTIQGLLSPPERRGLVAKAYAELRNGERPPSEEPVQMLGLRRDGTTFPGECRLRIARQGCDMLFVMAVRDVSAEVAAKEAMAHARDEALAAAKAKSDLLAVMSHEMRTPLNGLLGTMELMRDEEMTDRQRDRLRIIETSGRLLLSHVNDVLDISRLDSGKVDLTEEAFDLEALLTEVAEGQRSLAQARDTEITVALDPALPQYFTGDPIRLRQIVLNLVGNAAKFTEGGTVMIEAERGLPGEVELRVIDTGCGMSKQNLMRIFEDFVTLDSSYTRTSGGTGLGLGIVRRLVRAMGGKIGAESEEGAGSVFTLHLPLRSAEQPIGSVAASEPDPQVPARRILVVEDNEINRIVVSEMLRKEGHEVTLACDGAEGVATAQGGGFDLILMDISMPRMDGVTATRTIRGTEGPCRFVPIAALTAHAMPEEIARFHEAGMQHVLTKPLSRAALRDLILSAGTPPKAEDGEAAVETCRSEVVDQAVRDAFYADLGEDRAGELLETYIEDSGRSLSRLVEQSESLPARQLQAELHRLAGAAGLFGAVRLTEALRRLETLGKTGQEPAMRAGVARLPEIWEATVTQLVSRGSAAA
ncbi:hybrid sensor histidine kinase/response regulator [Pseudoroseicyclus aestuarii]|uniref:histidine kinase n=1 Tax=Pseudoroseicyclus aestuarii TaxID=1795041 RepID=A0A318SSQ5_9RHOB|nr:ATP-binding protein [Pseudoroseicyclus aestuarii]PYE84733.1 PAS/PAC sensor hybrid histidine kinase [Pseudoroseicyclus aestuarii]